ncbi:hypothetical protein [Maribacter sp. 2308TA10-17]|uniref:hypothetical protein n=1 Tax=Maribacter sp. 2308TA10-17 TaxID=3386276 RepID=UPI0039BCDB20
MKTLILTLLFLIGNSCDPISKEAPVQIAETTVESVDSNDSNSLPPIQESMNPGEVTLKIKIMEVFDSTQDICGVSQTNVMKMSVKEILSRGSSIVNLPKKNDEALMNFLIAPVDLPLNTLIEAKAKEGLCRDASKTYYTIISYKIVD